MTGLDAVKSATWALHTRAERCGVIADIVSGRANRFEVALLLRNLLPVYQVLDGSSRGNAALARSAAIEADLRVLSPDGVPPLLAAGQAYVERVRGSAERGGEGLIAHAYVRYLGDLNGGAILRRRLMVCLGEVARGLRFFDYPDLRDRAAFTLRYRAELDQAVRGGRPEDVATEAAAVFKMNIALSEAVKEAAL